jgi:hypothetical protein
MDWRPIETAPKDGTQVFLANHEHIAIGAWFEDWATEEVFENKSGDTVTYRIERTDRSYWEYEGDWFTATHWAPLDLPQPNPQFNGE